MRVPVIGRRTPAHRYWSGMLCGENFAAVAQRLTTMLDGTFYTFVSANSYNENEWRFSQVDARTSNRLVSPPRLCEATVVEPYWSINFTDQSYCWGLHTSALTEQAARDGGKHNKIRISFNDRHRETESVTIDHYAPAGYALQWIIALEDHEVDS